LPKVFSQKSLLGFSFPSAFDEKRLDEPKIVMRAWLLGFLFAILGLYIAFIK